MSTKQNPQNVIQLTVPTANRFQRDMLRNLKEEAKNRISKKRAIRAQQLLDELESENPKADGVAPTDIQVQVVKTHIPAMNHQSDTDRNISDPHGGICGSVIQFLRKYLC